MTGAEFIDEVERDLVGGSLDGRRMTFRRGVSQLRVPVKREGDRVRPRSRKRVPLYVTEIYEVPLGMGDWEKRPMVYVRTVGSEKRGDSAS